MADKLTEQELKLSPTSLQDYWRSAIPEMTRIVCAVARIPYVPRKLPPEPLKPGRKVGYNNKPNNHYKF